MIESNDIESTTDLFKNLWIEKYRPKTLDDIILSDKNRLSFNEIKRKQEIPHIMFSGSPGIGKSTLTKILVKDVLDCQYLYINASNESGVDVIRTKVINFAQTRSIDGKLKVIILDEIDGLSATHGSGSGTSAQQALRNVIEEFSANTRFIATCNYRSMVIEALDSRFQTYDLTPPIEKVVERAIRILKTENVTIPEDQKELFLTLIKTKWPDIRKVIGELQKHVINGKLVLEHQTNNLEFAEEVFNRIQKKQIDTLRQFIIQNEIKFSNNYHTFLKNMFEVVYNSKLDFEKKRVIMLLIANAMGQDSQVMDHEINAYSCMLELSNAI